MSFLFGKKNKSSAASTPGGKEAGGNANAPTNATNVLREKEKLAGGQSVTPGGSTNNSVNSVGGANTPSPEQNARGASIDQDEKYSARPGINGPAIPNGLAANPNLYPWSQRRLTFTSAQPNPFPRYGAAVNATSSKEGDIYVMGGLVNGSTVKGDLWMIEAGGGNLACYPIGTTSEGPNPRVGHASLLVGNAFIVFGGDTKQEDTDSLDDTLYLLNTSTRQWSRALPPGPHPAGRYGHTLNILGSKIYVFGGQVDGHFFNDLLAFDLNQLQSPHNRWEMLVQDSSDSEKEQLIPLGRTNHSIVTYNDKLYLFGGTDGVTWLNDVWTYDPRVNEWSQLDCIGYIPVPREGHSAALVGDVMYIFGGRTQEGNDLGDLAAFRITSRRWYTFQNMGPSPSPRSGHSMTSYGKQIVVLAGEPSSEPSNPSELSLVYVLDTAKIRYPNDQQIQQTPSGERVPGNRRPSGADKSGIPLSKGLAARDTSMGPPDGPRGKFGDSREGMNSPSMIINGDPNLNTAITNGISPPLGSRLPRVASSQAPSGPPPQQQAPPPRANGPIPVAANSRSRTPTGNGQNYGPSQGTNRGPSLDRQDMAQAGPGPEAQGAPRSRAMSPATNGRPIMAQQVQQQPSKLGNALPDGDGPPATVMASRSGPPPGSGPPPLRQQLLPENNEAPPKMQQMNQQRSIPQQMDNVHQEQPTYSNQSKAVDTASSKKIEALAQELEGIKSRNAWLSSELALAQKAGYNKASTTSADDPGIKSIGNENKSLVEALMTMRSGLAEIQRTVPVHVHEAAQKVAEIESQRNAALREAAQARAKIRGHEGSRHGTPQLDDTMRDVSDLHGSADLGNKLSVALVFQSDLKAKLEAMSNELQAEKKAREVAEDNAEAANRKVAELDQARNPGEIESLRAELFEAQRIARDEAAQRADANARAKLLEVDKEDARRELDEVRSTSTNHVTVLGSLREAVTVSSEKAALLEQKLEDEREQRENMQRKLFQLRTDHEERTSELESTSRRLRDAEELAEKHAAEAEKHRAVVLSGLDQLNAKPSDDPKSAGMDKRVLILQQQVKEGNSLIQKSQEEADLASEKLRSAEERIAGLEAYQQQTSRESLGIRKQLQEAVRAAQTFQGQHAELKQRLENHQRDASAMSIQHGVLKDLLGERAGSATRDPGSPSTGLVSADAVRLRELEQRLEESRRSHEDTKASFESREQESESAYREKIEQLEQDYQSAVSYVKGTEKMLKRMKDELGRSKTTNARLQAEVDKSPNEMGTRSLNDAPADWEVERQALQQEITEMQESMKGSVYHLDQQIQELQNELGSAQQERNHYRNNNEQVQQHISQITQQARADIEKLRSENAFLEARASEAEKKVSSLLDQFETSVDNYRRRSQGPMANLPNGVHVGGHTRNPSSISDVTSTGGESSYSLNVDNDRNSQALDNLASELETLRTQWEGTHRSNRLSDQFEFERSPSNGAGGELSNSLATWRKRLDAEEKDKQSGASPIEGQANAMRFGSTESEQRRADTISPLRSRGLEEAGNML